MANIAKAGTPEILMSVDKADDGTPQRAIFSVDLTATPSLSSTHMSRLHANTGGYVKTTINGQTRHVMILIREDLPESEWDDVARAADAEAKAKRKSGKPGRQSVEF